jgi:HEAT repeat protein
MKDALGDPAETTRVTAVRDLGLLAPERAAPVLRRVLLYDAYATVRREAAKSLTGYPPAIAVPTLIEGLGDEMSDVRLAAAHALEVLSGKTFGDDRRAWVQWWHAQSGAAPAADATPAANK